VDLEGPSVPQALLQIGIECPEETDGLAEGNFHGDNLRIFSKPGFIERGFRILIRPDHRSELIDALDSAGVVQLTDEDYEILRVESGMPAPGRELSEEYTPLEVNLYKAISKDKGCYTGQEVIARQINYDKITRRMVGLQLKTLVSTKARIQVDGKQAGEIESVVESPRFGTIALAILKRPYYEPGTEVEVMDEFKQLSGRVCLLPFSELAGAV
jgi:folate-binding protein YgfZ